MWRLRVIHGVSISSRPGTQPRSPDASDPARIRLPWHPLPAWRQGAPRAVRLAAALAGLAVIITYLVIALSRLTYPFTIEWLESNSLVEVHRILAGQPLYPAPTAGYVPDGYPPLYFAVSAAAASVLGVSYLPLRLVSLVSSLFCFAVLGRLVQRETGSAAAGTAAAGVFASVYFATHTWFDVGRVDSLFLALSIGGLYAARWMRRTRGAIACGALLAAAALTKQTGIAEGVVVLAALAFGPRRRLAGVAALTEVAVLGISTLVLGLGSGGWYVYYVFQLMSEHALNDSAIGGFWIANPVRHGSRRVRRADRRRGGRRWCCWRAAAPWWSRATPRWCTAAVTSTTCCPRTWPWHCSRAWRWVASGPGGSPECPACWCSPRRCGC